MSKSGEGSSGKRRSLGIFPRQSLSGLTPIHTDVSTDLRTKKRRVNSPFFASSSSAEAADLQSPKSDVDPAPSPKGRGRTLIKNGRPSSIFGSLRSMHSSAADEEDRPYTALSREGSVDEEEEEEGKPLATDRTDRSVLHHGEVQTTGGVFRKRKEYLVLTDKHLIRFKSQSKASEVFPW